MAADHLKAWIAKARVSGITILIKFAKTYAAHRTGILVFMIITPQLLRLKAQIIKSKPCNGNLMASVIRSFSSLKSWLSISPGTH